METESGIRIATDPYDAGCGYPVKDVEAEIAQPVVTVTLSPEEFTL